jgi:hypothetical protein
VLALRAPHTGPPTGSLGSAGLARSLRSLAVPAHILSTDAETAQFAGQAPVEQDESTPPTTRGG